jgi:hypothetical protein
MGSKGKKDRFNKLLRTSFLSMAVKAALQKREVFQNGLEQPIFMGIINHNIYD